MPGFRRYCQSASSAGGITRRIVLANRRLASGTLRLGIPPSRSSASKLAELRPPLKGEVKTVTYDMASKSWNASATT
jgi:hypothetical protein